MKRFHVLAVVSEEFDPRIPRPLRNCNDCILSFFRSFFTSDEVTDGDPLEGSRGGGCTGCICCSCCCGLGGKAFEGGGGGGNWSGGYPIG